MDCFICCLSRIAAAALKGKICRWFNQLSPLLKREPFSANEDALIIQVVALQVLSQPWHLPQCSLINHCPPGTPAVWKPVVAHCQAYTWQVWRLTVVLPRCCQLGAVFTVAALITSSVLSLQPCNTGVSLVLPGCRWTACDDRQLVLCLAAPCSLADTCNQGADRTDNAVKNRWNSTLKRKLSLRATLDRNFHRTLNGEEVPEAFSHGVSYQQLTTEMTQLVHVLQTVLVEFTMGNPCITQEACLPSCCLRASVEQPLTQLPLPPTASLSLTVLQLVAAPACCTCCSQSYAASSDAHCRTPALRLQQC